jgi:hypothetical protein
MLRSEMLLDFERDIARPACVLAAAVEPSFGPCGADALIRNPHDSGTLISNSGAAIVASLRTGHPAARFLLGVVQAFDREAADGSAALLLMLAAAARALARLLSTGGGGYAAGASSAAASSVGASASPQQRRLHMTQLSRAFSALASSGSGAPSLSQWLWPAVRRQLLRVAPTGAAPPAATPPPPRMPHPPCLPLADALRGLVGTALAGPFSHAARALLQRLLLRWVRRHYRGGGRAQLASVLQHLLRGWTDAVLLSPGAALSDSRLVRREDIILRRSLHPRGVGLPRAAATAPPLRFVVMHGSLAPVAPTVAVGASQQDHAGHRVVAAVLVASAAELGSARASEAAAVAARAAALRRAGIGLVLSTVELHPQAASALAAHGIAAAELLEPEEAEALCDRAAVHPLGLTDDRSLAEALAADALAAAGGAVPAPGRAAPAHPMAQPLRQGCIGRARGGARQISLGGVTWLCLTGVGSDRCCRGSDSDSDSGSDSDGDDVWNAGIAAQEQPPAEQPPLRRASHVHQLLLRAPTDGMLRVYEKALRRALSMLAAWAAWEGPRGGAAAAAWDDSQEELACAGGGGSCEGFMSALLEQRAAATATAEVARGAEAMRVLSAALQAVPTALWRSAHATPQPAGGGVQQSHAGQSQLLRARHALAERALAADAGGGERCLGAVFAPVTSNSSIRTCELADPLVHGVLEPPHVPWLRLVRCAECLAQLLRIDAVVPVRAALCAPGRHATGSSSSDDGGGDSGDDY